MQKRKQNTHKGDYGRVLIVAGSSGMTGAAILAARGALRSGAGLTYLAVPKKLVDYVDALTPEVITIPLERIKDIKADAIAIGPGLGQGSKIIKIIHSLVISHSSLVIDADALNVIAKNTKLLKKAKANIVITPHPGEMSRLVKKDIAFVQRHRSVVAKMAAQIFKCVVVLKGHRTVVADPSGKTFINQTGNPGMASGGVGDVLTGMIASFIAQGKPVFYASVLGVQLHGLAGDLAAKDKGEYGMIASDLVDKIPYAIQKSR
ncbi:MAG: NAD(P)H-hydrate dehydratase [Candidatus Margulisiibacteriota bacterium]